MRKYGVLILTAITCLTLVTCKKKPADKSAAGGKAMQADDMAQTTDGDATANWGAIIKKTKTLHALLKETKTLEDLNKNKDKIASLQVGIIQMNLASAKAALKLDKKGVQAFLAKAAKTNAENGKLKAEIMTEMQRLAKIEGVQKIQAEMMKALGAKITPLVKELGETQKKLVAKAK